MSRILTSLDETDLWQVWFDKTNILIDTFTETVTLKANSAGDLSTGNGFVTGTFGATTLVGSTLRGGTVDTPAYITFSSNGVFTGSQINATANVSIVSTSQLFSTNSSVTALSITSNGVTTNTNIAGDNFRTTANSIFGKITADGLVTFGANTTINGTTTLNANVVTIANSQSFQTNSSVIALRILSNGTSTNTNIAGDNFNVTANSFLGALTTSGLATLGANTIINGTSTLNGNVATVGLSQQFSTNSTVIALRMISDGSSTNTIIGGNTFSVTANSFVGSLTASGLTTLNANVVTIANSQSFQTNSSIIALRILSNGTTTNTTIAGNTFTVSANSFVGSLTTSGGITFSSGNSITNYTVSTSPPSGGNNGDVWIVVT